MTLTGALLCLWFLIPALGRSRDVAGAGVKRHQRFNSVLSSQGSTPRSVFSFLQSKSLMRVSVIRQPSGSEIRNKKKGDDNLVLDEKEKGGRQ